MISNDLLGNRLNSFKQGSLKKGPSSSHTPSYTQLIYEIFSAILSGFWLFAKILIYGCATKLICSTNWNSIDTILIGTTIVLIMTYIYNLINDKYKK